MPTKIVLDKREKALISLFETHSIEHETKQLDLGDVQIIYSKGELKDSNHFETKNAQLLLRTLQNSKEESIEDDPELGKIHSILIERKSFTDLKASMSDGRYHEQKSRYKQLPRGSVYYILENNDPKYEQLGWKQYIGAYIHTIMRDNIPVIITNSTEETHKIIIKIAQALDEFGPDSNNNSASIESSQIKKKKVSGKEVYKQQLCCFPGISSGKADSIAETYPTITKLIEAISSGTFKVKGIGPVLASKIKEGLRLENNQSSIVNLKFE